ncbi:MAG TPA: pilus assembly protein TadG-related protein, partial [Verrucomicrobiae bacterium]|nr:pilus assembly protein TadG-related protein [Verrucomicrobiae bacterium]
MKRPLIIRRPGRNRERGFTMALVAVAMMAILAMAALSIDAVTLYLAREEAQRAADAAALAGARILSLSGMTGDPSDATSSWSPACNAATTVATAIAQQNQIAGQSLPAAQIAVTFPNNPGCAGGSAVFGINPEVSVKVTRQNLPTFFARIWGSTSATVAASATA